MLKDVDLGWTAENCSYRITKSTGKMSAASEARAGSVVHIQQLPYYRSHIGVPLCVSRHGQFSLSFVAATGRLNQLAESASALPKFSYRVFPRISQGYAQVSAVQHSGATHFVRGVGQMLALFVAWRASCQCHTTHRCFERGRCC